MPLQSSGQISMEQVRNEFKAGSGSISFSELYRGGSNVPNDAFCHNNTIPVTGQISINGFYNTTKGNLYYDNQNLDPIPTNATRAQVWVQGGGGGGAFMHVNVGVIAYRASAGGGGGGYTGYQVSGLSTNVRFTASRGGGGPGDTSGQGTGPEPYNAGSSTATIIRKSDGATLSTFTGGGGGGGWARNGPYQGAVTGYGTGGSGGTVSASSSLPSSAFASANGSAGVGANRTSGVTAGGQSGSGGAFGGIGGRGGRISSFNNASESGQAGFVRFRF